MASFRDQVWGMILDTIDRGLDNRIVNYDEAGYLRESAGRDIYAIEKDIYNRYPGGGCGTGALEEYIRNMLNMYLGDFRRNRRSNYNYHDNYNHGGYRSYDNYRDDDVGGGLSGIVRGSRENRMLDAIQINRDSACVSTSSNYAKEVDRQRRAGDITVNSTPVEQQIDTTKSSSIPGVVYIGENVDPSEIPSMRKLDGTANNNPPLVDTEMYQITDAYTLVQNNTSRTKIIFVTLKKAVYNTKDAVANMRYARPDLFDSTQYCVVLTYHRLVGYRINNGGCIIFDRGNKLKEITNDVTDMYQFTEKYETILNELPKPLVALIDTIFFTRLNTVVEYCLWKHDDPTSFIKVDSWNKMGLFTTVQDIADNREKKRLLDYVNHMKNVFGAKGYPDAVFDIVKRSFEQTLSGANGFIDIRKDHKEYATIMPHVNITLDDRYYLRDLFIMPNESQSKLLSLLTKDHLVVQHEKTMIVTNMSLSTSIGPGINIIKNNTSNLLNSLREIVNTVNRTDLLVGQYTPDGDKPVSCARLGLNIDGRHTNSKHVGLMKIKRVSV